MLTNFNNSLAVYIHWPFCVSKCPYCDFNSHVRRHISIQAWENAFRHEIEMNKDYLIKHTVSSIFFGGGTPSLMPPALIRSLLDMLSPYLADHCEVSLEANPESSSLDLFMQLRDAGITRLSLGIQSLRDDKLSFLQRPHNQNDAKNAIIWGQKAFDNMSLDFIYTLPNESLDSWLQELNYICTLSSPHLSLYQLTIEEKTPFFHLHKKGQFIMPSESTSLNFYTKTAETLEKKGYIHYEVSNFAQEGYLCRHNLTYWQYGYYLGLGPGAHSRLPKHPYRLMRENIKLPEAYLRAISDNAHYKDTLLTQEDIIDEYLLCTLRLQDGLSKQDFLHVCGISIDHATNKTKRHHLQKEGFLIESDDRLTLTRKGRLCYSSVISFLR